MIEPGRLPELLQALDCQALLVSAPANVRYLSGFTTPEDGRVLVTESAAWLITDGRYEVQAGEESRLPVALHRDWLPWVVEQVADRALAVEADHLTVSEYARLREGIGRDPGLRENILRGRRMIKSERELDHLGEAARLADAAFAHILDFIRPGVLEIEVALELERFMRLRGAEDKSFDIIVASGPRSAMPHGLASARKIGVGELVTMDFGARVNGYHGDMTRTVAVGDPGDEAKAIYHAVNEALEASLSVLRPGRRGDEVDAAAREVLADRDLADRFVHGLGHGVGLEIHEGPRLGRGSGDVLEPGMTVTIEPGVYLPGRYGVRIEELAVVTDDGYRLLSSSPRDYQELDS